MDLAQVGLVLIGAVVGAVGSIVVGVYLQRRESDSRSRSAARAVWFELGINAVAIELARDHGVFTDLGRSSFDRLLPDLATWLTMDELQVIAAAYQGHAGYQQAWRDSSLPDAVRRQVLARLAEATHEAHDRLATRAFGSAAHTVAPAGASQRTAAR